jgi:hypothetical protein
MVLELKNFSQKHCRDDYLSIATKLFSFLSFLDLIERLPEYGRFDLDYILMGIFSAILHDYNKKVN